MTVLTLILLIAAGTILGRALDDLTRATVTSLRGRRARRARERAIAEPFVASNQHAVYVTGCPCGRPTCQTKMIQISQPDGATAPTKIGLPPAGAEAAAVLALRGLIDDPDTPDMVRAPALAAAEFLEHMTDRKGAHS